MKKGKTKKVNKKIKLIILIAIVLIIAIISTIIIRNIIIQNEINNSEYLATGNENSSLIANYIKKGVTIGGITGTFEVLDTSDADATPEDIFKGKTAYVKGVKITGTRFSIGEAIEKGYVFEEDTTIKDDLENEVRIPGGFHIAEDSATKVEDGIVIEDDIGNQFVWIPAKTGAGATIHTTLGDKTLVYQRTALDDQVATGEIDATTNSEKIKSSSSESYYYTEKMPTDEEASVNVNGGYYIGRYEAGDKVSTDAGKMRASGDNQQNEVSIKAGQAPYVWATYENQKKLAEGMDTVRKYTGITKLTSSYAWDTAINFIKIKTPDYDSNSLQGNYLDTTFSYANVGETEKTQIKENGSSQLVPTGQTTAVSNIYDMGGNAYERTTESNSYTSNSLSSRGGFYFDDASGYPAGSRGSIYGDAGSGSSFRVTLFCSTER